MYECAIVCAGLSTVCVQDCLQCVSGLSTVCVQDCLQCVSGLSTVCVWTVYSVCPGLSTVCVWTIHSVCLDYPQCVSGLSTVCVQDCLRTVFVSICNELKNALFNAVFSDLCPLHHQRLQRLHYMLYLSIFFSFLLFSSFRWCLYTMSCSTCSVSVVRALSAKWGFCCRSKVQKWRAHASSECPLYAYSTCVHILYMYIMRHTVPTVHPNYSW